MCVSTVRADRLEEQTLTIEFPVTFLFLEHTPIALRVFMMLDTQYMYYIQNMIPSCSGGGLSIQPSDLISLKTVYDNNIHRVQKQCEPKDT